MSLLSMYCNLTNYSKLCQTFITCFLPYSLVPNVEGDFFQPSFVSKFLESHIVMAEVR